MLESPDGSANFSGRLLTSLGISTWMDWMLFSGSTVFAVAESLSRSFKLSYSSETNELRHFSNLNIAAGPVGFGLVCLVSTLRSVSIFGVLLGGISFRGILVQFGSKCLETVQRIFGNLQTPQYEVYTETHTCECLPISHSLSKPDGVLDQSHMRFHMKLHEKFSLRSSFRI